jgi:hypothetical protein
MYLERFSSGIRKFFPNGKCKAVVPEGVTQIGYGCFCQTPDSLTKIEISSTVEYLCFYCFTGCRGLKSVYIPEGVKKLSFGIFSGCLGLEIVFFPKSLVDCEHDIFQKCYNLKAVVVPRSKINIYVEKFSSYPEIKEKIFSYDSKIAKKYFLTGYWSQKNHKKLTKLQKNWIIMIHYVSNLPLEMLHAILSFIWLDDIPPIILQENLPVDCIELPMKDRYV